MTSARWSVLTGISWCHPDHKCFNITVKRAFITIDFVSRNILYTHFNISVHQRSSRRTASSQSQSPSPVIHSTIVHEREWNFLMMDLVISSPWPFLVILHWLFKLLILFVLGTRILFDLVLICSWCVDLVDLVCWSGWSNVDLVDLVDHFLIQCARVAPPLIHPHSSSVFLIKFNVHLACRCITSTIRDTGNEIWILEMIEVHMKSVESRHNWVVWNRQKQ